MIHLNAPLTKEDIRSLHAGDRVLLSGVIYTARDAAHARLCAALDAGDLTMDEYGAVGADGVTGTVGSELPKRLSDFDVRNYGFKKLRPFLKSLGAYEFDEPGGANGQRQIYLRVRES